MTHKILFFLFVTCEAFARMLFIFLPDHHKELLISVGGIDFTQSFPQPSKSSFTFDGHTWSSGVISDLPEAIGWQCLAKIDEDELIGVGGADVQFVASKAVFFYNGKKNIWIMGPSLRVPRYKEVWF